MTALAKTGLIGYAPGLLYETGSRVVPLRSNVGLLILPARIAVGQDTTSPIASWAFDEGSGTTALDSSGNNHSATLVGATYVIGWSNAALSFNGSNSYAFIADSSAGGTTATGLDIGTRDWTIVALIKTTNSGMVVTKMAFVGGVQPDGSGPDQHYRTAQSEQLLSTNQASRPSTFSPETASL